MSQYSPMFVYYYDYLMSTNEWVFGADMPFCVKNVCHAEDLIAVFFPFEWIDVPKDLGPAPKATEADKYVSRVVQSAWGNFAHTGNPNPLPDVAAGVAFERFNATANKVVRYGDPTVNMEGFHSSRCDVLDRMASPPYTRR